MADLSVFVVPGDGDIAQDPVRMLSGAWYHKEGEYIFTECFIFIVIIFSVLVLEKVEGFLLGEPEEAEHLDAALEAEEEAEKKEKQREALMGRKVLEKDEAEDAQIEEKDELWEAYNKDHVHHMIPFKDLGHVKKEIPQKIRDAARRELTTLGMVAISIWCVNRAHAFDFHDHDRPFDRWPMTGHTWLHFLEDVHVELFCTMVLYYLTMGAVMKYGIQYVYSQMRLYEHGLLLAATEAALKRGGCGSDKVEAGLREAEETIANDESIAMGNRSHLTKHFLKGDRAFPWFCRSMENYVAFKEFSVAHMKEALKAHPNKTLAPLGNTCNAFTFNFFMWHLGGFVETMETFCEVDPITWLVTAFVLLVIMFMAMAVPPFVIWGLLVFFFLAGMVVVSTMVNKKLVDNVVAFKTGKNTDLAPEKHAPKVPFEHIVRYFQVLLILLHYSCARLVVVERTYLATGPFHGHNEYWAALIAFILVLNLVFCAMLPMMLIEAQVMCSPPFVFSKSSEGRLVDAMHLYKYGVAGAIVQRERHDPRAVHLMRITEHGKLMPRDAGLLETPAATDTSVQLSFYQQRIGTTAAPAADSKV